MFLYFKQTYYVIYTSGRSAVYNTLNVEYELKIPIYNTEKR